MSGLKFDDYMGRQIERIRDYKRTLEEEQGREFTLEEAARHWVRDYAEHFREEYWDRVESPESVS